jgi:predicted lipoprotein
VTPEAGAGPGTRKQQPLAGRLAAALGLAALGAGALGGGFVGGCEAIPLGAGPRKLAVAAITAGVILPIYADLAAAAERLENATGALAAQPTLPRLEEAQQAWRAAHTIWKESDPFLFGPAKGQDQLGRFDFSTAVDDDINPAYVEMELSGSAELTPAYVAERGTSRKGFHALEYLLFLPGAGNAAALDRLARPDDGAARRRQYLVGLAADLGVRIRQLRGLWVDGPKHYGALLAAPGGDNPEYSTIKQAVDAILSGLVHVCDRILIEHIGEPFGHKSGGEPRPEQQESPFSDQSVADMQASLLGLERVYCGARPAAADCPGLSLLVARRSAGGDQRLRAAIVAAQTALSEIPRPYTESLVSHRTAVQAGYDAILALRRLLAGEVQSLLGASVAPVDTDQD